MPLSLSELNEKKQVFAMIVGKLLAHYFDFDRERAAQFQAGLVALKTKYGDNFNAFRVDDEENLRIKLTESGITADDLSNARGIVDTEDQSGVMKGVPPLGDIGVKLGMIDPRNKDPLMAVQAAIRTLDTAEAIAYGAQRKESNRLNTLVYDLAKQPDSGKEGITPEFARGFIGFKSPEYLIKAQALNHMADVLGALINNLNCEANGMVMAMEALAVEVVLNASEACKALGDITSPKLTRDLQGIGESLKMKIKRANQIDLEADGTREKCLNDIQHSIGLIMKAAREKGEQIEFTNVGDIETLLQLRFNQLAGKTRSSAIDNTKAVS